MKKIGNLFELAEKRLIREKKLRIIPCYTELDVIEYAVKIRKWLDNNPKKFKQIMKLTREEIKINNREARKRYYLKTGK
jgi:hypothetical protein